MGLRCDNVTVSLNVGTFLETQCCNAVLHLLVTELNLVFSDSTSLLSAFSLVDVYHGKLECGPMSNVMAAQPNISGAFCESSVIQFLVPTSQSVTDAVEKTS